MFEPRNDYKKEREFSQELSKWLDIKKIRNRMDEKTYITSKHNKGNKRKRPDITLKQQKKILSLNRQKVEKKLSNPFFIECKMGSDHSKKNGFTDLRQIIDNYSQYIKYKYKEGSKKHQKCEKFGDYNVAITCPTLLSGNYKAHKFEEEYINRAQLTRTLWHLGLGLVYKKQDKMIISFNQEEVLYIE